MKKLLVPIDFEDTTLNALNYGISIADKFDYEIHLLHLIESESERKSAQSKIDEVISKYDREGKSQLVPHIVKGKIATDIGKTAETLEASFIIMGTHKNKRLEKIFGSKAIKVVAESKIPFITLQENSSINSIDKIAMTIDLEKESIQIVKIAKELAQVFGSEIILIGGDHTDNDLKAKVAVNVKTTRRQLADSGISSSVVLLERKDFLNNFIDYCSKNDVDLIAATYYPDTFKVFSSKFVQKLIENEARIPVLTLDSKALGKTGNYSF